MIRLLTLPAGFILDLLMGDPRWLYHPVCLIGNLISILEKGIRKVFPKTDKGAGRRHSGSCSCLFYYLFYSLRCNPSAL